MEESGEGLQRGKNQAAIKLSHTAHSLTEEGADMKDKPKKEQGVRQEGEART